MGTVSQIWCSFENWESLSDLRPARSGLLWEMGMELLLRLWIATWAVIFPHLRRSWSRILTVTSRPDLAISDAAAQNLTIWLGKGDGSFVEHVVVATRGGALVAGDFNGDGIVDLAVAHAYDNDFALVSSIGVLLGKGDGTFGAPFEYSINATQSGLLLAVGDMNADGAVDLIVGGSIGTGFPQNFVSVLLGRGDGTFAPPLSFFDPTRDLSGAGALSVGDLNGDGKLDVVLADELNTVVYGGSDHITVLMGNGDGTFSAPARYPAEDSVYPLGILIADLDGDGRDDVLVSYTGGTIQIFPGNGDGTLQSGAIYNYGEAWGPPLIGDFNGDGRIDFAVATGYLGLGGVLPFLRASVSDTGVFVPGQATTFTITISNHLGSAVTNSPVTVGDNFVNGSICLVTRWSWVGLFFRFVLTK